MNPIPTISQLFLGIVANLEAEFNATIQVDGKSDLRVQSSVHASKLKQFYLAVAQLQKNIWPDSSDEETLLRFGYTKLKRFPFPAIAGQYQVSVTGSIGAIIPAKSIFKSDDSALNPGILYMLDNQYQLVSTTDLITLRALTGGLEGKLNINDTLTSTAPIALVNNPVTVVLETIQPLAAEDIEDYRQKVLDSFQLEPNGGSTTDYRLWAADAQGVAKVFPYAVQNAPNYIDLFIEAEVVDSLDGKGTPTAQIIAEVESVINFNPETLLARRPTDVILNYLPITPRTIEITLTGFQGLTALIQTQLIDAFTAAIANIRPFVAAADQLIKKNDIIDTNKLIGIIFLAKPAAQFTNVTFKVDGVSYTSYTFTYGDIPWLDPNVIFN